MKMEILFEDKNVSVVNKPAGLLVHADQKSTEDTLADWVLKKYPKIKNVGETMTLAGGKIISRPGIVHRLDKDTTGVLLIAKNQETFLFLKKQFQDRTIKKIYQAIVYGNVKNDCGIINAEIGRSKNDPRLRTAMRGKRGKLREAITEYKALKRIKLKVRKRSDLKNSKRSDLEETFSLLELKPKTGRTHQIRVHMKYLNHPILCDKLYAPNLPCALGMAHLALHATSIEFDLPTGKRIKVEAPLPKDMQNAIKA